jgi:hypothetical protein
MPVDLVRKGGSGTSLSGLYTVVSSINLIDPFGQVWTLTVGTNGNLITTLSSGPFFEFFVLEDSNGVFWKVFLTGNNGNLDTTNNGIAALAVQNLFIQDSSGRNWYLTVTTGGNLDTI